MFNNDVITGGCACGAVRYACTGEPLLSTNCHCRDCQRASGTAYAAIIVVWKKMFEVTFGKPSFYVRSPHDDDYLHRGFCATCGSPVAMLRPSRPQLAYILAGSLDSPALYQPTMNIFTEQAHSWDAMDADLDTFNRMPPIAEEFGR